MVVHELLPVGRHSWTDLYISQTYNKAIRPQMI
jgi:hypothetical protein